MGRVPILTSREIIGFFRRQGFDLHRQTGSHAVYKHADGRSTVIPVHPGDVLPRTFVGILDLAGFTVDDYLRLR